MLEQGLFKTIIRDKVYNICGKIGEGGAGTVFLAKDPKGISYALKVVRLDRKNAFQKKMLEDEIKIQKSFKGNPYVIQYIDVKQTQQEVSIILELGEYSLRNALDIRRITQQDLLNILCDVSTGLHQIHSRTIIHRDIKPENIIFKNGIYKITDFGIAVEQEEDDSVIGTIPYWAPQILNNQDTYTNKIDIWSLAVTAFQCYFKVNPFCFRKNLSQRELIEEMKENVKILTPKFNMHKFQKLLQDKKCFEQLKYVKKKLQNTKQNSLIQNLCSLFQPDPEKRDPIDFVTATFCSIRESIPPRNPRKTKYNQKFDINLVPEDIRMFTRAKDLFYDFNLDQKNSQYDATLFALQLGIWYLQGANYGGVHYIKLDKINYIKDYREPKAVLWKLVFENLSKFYYQLKFNSQNEDIIYFDKLNELRMHILICSVWMKIINDSTNYCKKVSQITGFDINNPLQLMEMLQLVSQSKLGKIQELILMAYS